MADKQRAREFRNNVFGICLIGAAGIAGMFVATQYLFNRKNFIETMDTIDAQAPAAFEEIIKTIKGSFAADSADATKATPQDTLKIN